MSTCTDATNKFILLLGIDDELFKMCYGHDPLWKCQLESLPEDCSKSEIATKLQQPGLICVVVDSVEIAADLKEYYDSGGFIVFFGIEGVYTAPKNLSAIFGLEWDFSAYTKYNYVLTDVGKNILGDAITEQQYSKSNLLSVPVGDRIFTPKPDFPTFEAFAAEEYDEEDDIEYVRKQYTTYMEGLGRQVPLALHTASHGGQIGYLGFVNGDGYIPNFVRAFCSKTLTEM